MKCCVANCTNSYKKGASLMTFPKDPVRREKWILSLFPNGPKPRPNDRVCEVHFDPSDWLDYNRKKLLKCSAVPYISDFPRGVVKKIQNKTKVLDRGKDIKVHTNSVRSLMKLPTFQAIALGLDGGVPVYRNMPQEKQEVLLRNLQSNLEKERSALMQYKERLIAELSVVNELQQLRDMELKSQFCALDDQL